jgi:flagellar basal-body rod modification protein FlgD
MINVSGMTGSGISQPGNSKKAPGEIGQDDFLKLMVTQLKNQDPFSPMENGEFLAQIAQFTTATGIQELQQSFERFSQHMATGEALQAASLIGRSVIVESEAGYLSDDGSLTGTLQLPIKLQNCKVGIYSESGELLREIELGEQQAGDVDFSWDGKNAKGKTMPPGRYLISASTVIDGQEWALPTYVTADVQSVTLGSNGMPPTLSLAGIGEVSLSYVNRIR